MGAGPVAPRDPVPLRDFSDSPLPVTPIWDAPESAWHAAYPEGMPPRIEFEAVRAERLLESAVNRYPDRLALRYFKTAWTYEELLVRVKIAAASLQRVGVHCGSRLMLVLPNCPEFIVLWFAAHWLGAEVVPANPLVSSSELVHLAKKCNIDTVAGLDVRLKPIGKMSRQVPVRNLITVSLAPHLPWFLAIPYQLQKLVKGRAAIADDTNVMSFGEFFDTTRSINLPALNDVDQPAVLQPTGGTTGSSKVAVLTHRNLCSNVAQLHTWSGLEPGTDTFLSVLPYFHIYGATCAMLSPLVGGSTLLIQARFHPYITTRLIQKYKPTVALLVPFMIKALNEVMRKKNIRLDSLKRCMSGASPLAEDDAREFEARTGAIILEGFGLSEASPVTHSNPADGSARIGSIGLPLPNTEVKLVDLETGLLPVAPGEIGELAIRGPQVMQGYLDDPIETAIALRQGWLYTGDVAVMSHDGFFEIVDRKKDMIISGGLNVFPSEVEEVLLKHASIEACAVVGQPDRKYGELVCAFVVPVAGASIDVKEVREFCRDELSGYKIPKEVRIVDELPETFLGKIRRVELRKAA